MAKSQSNTKVYIIGGIVLFISLLVIFRLAKVLNPSVGQVAVTTACLNANTPLTIHWHPKLTIYIDGQKEKLPQNIGVTPSCEHYLHTHTQTGEDEGLIHVESQAPEGTIFTLQDFFIVWNMPIERGGYTVSATVDGTAVTAIGAIQLKDGQNIVLNYKSIKN